MWSTGKEPDRIELRVGGHADSVNLQIDSYNKLGVRTYTLTLDNKNVKQLVAKLTEVAARPADRPHAMDRLL